MDQVAAQQRFAPAFRVRTCDIPRPPQRMAFLPLGDGGDGCLGVELFIKDDREDIHTVSAGLGDMGVNAWMSKLTLWLASQKPSICYML
jgi:hypothetical protein